MIKRENCTPVPPAANLRYGRSTTSAAQCVATSHILHKAMEAPETEHWWATSRMPAHPCRHISEGFWMELKLLPFTPPKKIQRSQPLSLEKLPVNKYPYFSSFKRSLVSSNPRNPLPTPAISQGKTAQTQTPKQRLNQHQPCLDKKTSLAQRIQKPI